MNVLGYYNDWTDEGVSKIQFDKMTHIVLCYAIPQEDGSLLALENEKVATQVVELARKNNCKALLCVGGAYHNGTSLEKVFDKITTNKAKCEIFSDSMLAMVEKFGFDGIDFAWEYPRYNNETYEQYEQLMLMLRYKLNVKGKLLSTTVISGVRTKGTEIIDARAQSKQIIKAVDMLNVKAYDSKGEDAESSSYEFAVACAKYWMSHCENKDKINLQIPCYSYRTFVTYGDLVSANADASSKDSVEHNGETVFYNGIETVEKKAIWCKENVGGIGLCSINNDTTDVAASLLAVVDKVAK